MRYLILIIYCVFTTGAYANLFPLENEISAYILAHKTQQLSLLKKMVQINSGTTNLAGVQRVGIIMQRELQQLGFKTHWAAQPKSMQRAATLIAKHKGKGKPILLIAHLDTVFPAHSPFQHVTIHKHTMKGPGIADDKGGLVVLLYALKALQASKQLATMNVTVVLTGDEEDSGKPTTISRKALKQAAQHAQIALDFEPAVNLNTISIARRGIESWTITAHGNASHSATIFKQGVGAGAIFELASVLNTMRITLMNEKYLSFNPGLIAGGTELDYNAKQSQAHTFGKKNVIAKIALTSGDLRFIDEAQKLATEKKITTMVQNSLPHTKASVVFQAGIPAMPPTANNLKLLKKYSEASIALGHGKVTPLDPGLRGAGDISFVAANIPANLVGLGPVGFATHTVGETVELASLPIQTQRAAVLLARLRTGSH